jgi:hypothetical protein
MKMFLVFLLSMTLNLSCSKLDYEDKCEDQGATYGPDDSGVPDQKDDICYCNGQNFNPYTNKKCEKQEFPTY